jgi:hypothetical protein
MGILPMQPLIDSFVWTIWLPVDKGPRQKDAAALYFLGVSRAAAYL